MKRKWLFLSVLLSCVVMLIGNRAGAISLLPNDALTISGYMRAEGDFHTGPANPNNAGLQKDYNQWNLVRSLLMTDINYKPSEHFKMFAKVRAEGDFTYQIDQNVRHYNAFPGYTGSGSGWRTAVSSDLALAELRDVYADISYGNLWVRAGKQQIVWGESDALRLLDVFNPLDLTQRLFLNPAAEQFENIRIPVWALRATYAIPNRHIEGLAVEGVFNPGDIVPTWLPSQGAPYNIVPNLPAFITTTEQSRRGDMSTGGRILGKIGSVNLTLNYLYTYNQDGILTNKGIFYDPVNGIPLLAGYGNFTPFSIHLNNEHPKINIYGASFNYAFEPLKTVFRGEFTYVPDQPYEERPAGTNVSSEFRRRATFRYVLGADKSTQLLPVSVTPSMTSIGLQFFQTIREGDPHDLAINQAKVDRVDNQMSLYMNQPFANDTVVATLLAVYDFKGSYWFQPGLKYKPGVHWIFDVYGNIIAGKDDRAYKFGALKFASGVFGRVAYQF